MSVQKRSRHGAGLGVDFAGGPVVDPTENVKALSEALSQRQDDLRDLNNKYLNARLRAIDDKLKQFAKHSRQTSKLESDRLDKIRQVDVSNAAATAAQLLTAVQTLGNTTGTTAETLRTAVANTATTIQNQTDRIVSAINERITVLEKTANTAQGKQLVSDPQLDRLATLVEKVVSAQTATEGKKEGLNLSAKVLIAVVSLVGAVVSITGGLIGIAGVLYAVLKP